MKTLSCFVCAFVLCAAAHAAAPSKESVEKLLVVTEVEKLLGSMQQQVEGMVKGGLDQAFESQDLPPAAKQVADSFRTKMMDNLKDEMSWAKMKDLYIQVYSETFTQEEIDGLLAFYASPTGKAFVAKTPIVMQKSMSLMQQRMGPMMQKMQQSIQETVQQVEALKSGAPGQPPTSGPESIKIPAAPSKP